MKLEVAPKATDQLSPTPIVQQTAFWGRVHHRLGFGIEAFDLEVRPSADGKTERVERGDLLVVRAPLSEECDSAYVPYGPELGPDADEVGTFLERLSRKLQPLLGPRCAFIRWDLPWTSIHARDPRDFTSKGEWRGAPENRLRELRMNFGTREHNLHKAPRDPLPPDTVMIDLTPTEEALLARMHHKTRYNIRLAERRGVYVEEGSLAQLDEWYAVYLETMARHRLEPMPLVHFRAMLEEGAEGSTSPVQRRLLLARYQGQLLAGLLLAIAPPRATYLYGGSTRQRRELMASYALQWAAMRLAKAQGCLDYDLLGAAPRNDAPHPLAGVHRFKIGFGGKLIHREGCWDFPYDERTYMAWRSQEEAHIIERGLSATITQSGIGD